MDLEINTDVQENGIKKIWYTPKPLRHDGLLLKIFPEKRSPSNLYKGSPIRFVACCFNSLVNLIACLTNEGQIVIVDIVANNYWALKKIETPSVIEFSNSQTNELYVGTKYGYIFIVDINRNYIKGTLIGHKRSVKSISFSSHNLCVSSSKSEGIIWDLDTKSKYQVLTMPDPVTLKFITFVPVTNHLIACANDDAIKIWQYGSWKNLKLMHLQQWNNHCIRNVTFTNSGTSTIFVGYLPNLAVFSSQSWDIYKVLTLPEYILTVKQANIPPMNFEWKCSKILVILSGQGTIYFYDLEMEKIVDKITSDCEILKFRLSPQNCFMATTLCNGSIAVYNIEQYIDPPNPGPAPQQTKASTGKIKLYKLKPSMPHASKEIEDLLTREKLKVILEEYGEYPSLHRLTIWGHLLELPNNHKHYYSIINHVTIDAFPDLKSKYPLESDQLLRNLRNLLNNLVTWCPFFANVTFLPVFVFPFVKIFLNRPLQCFEAVVTIILNWCQHWFEYYPLPPINVLSIVENILFDKDIDLLQHLNTHNITTALYVWPMLESAFSEVLSTKEWLIFWDHVLTNDPAFLPCAAAAYNIVQRTTILTLKTEKDVTYFYHNQNPLQLKRLLNKTYQVLGSTSAQYDPTQYFDNFERIKTDGYPPFIDYPKTMVELQDNYKKILDQEMAEAKCAEEQMLREKIIEWRNLLDSEKKEIEKERRRQMEKACVEKILQEQKKVTEEHRRLETLRQNLIQHEEKIMDCTLKRLKSMGGKKKATQAKIVDDKLTKSEEELLGHYSGLLKHKYAIGDLFADDRLPTSNTYNIVLEKQQQELSDELNKYKQSSSTKQDLKKLNIATGILTIEQLIEKVEMELANDAIQGCQQSDKGENNKLLQLQAEAMELENDVANLMQTLRRTGTYGDCRCPHQGRSRTRKHIDDSCTRANCSKRT